MENNEDNKTCKKAKKTNWQKFKKMITKNERNQGIAFLIGAGIGVYTTAFLLYFCSGGCSGLKLALTIPTILLTITGTVVSIFVGCSKLSDYYDWI